MGVLVKVCSLFIHKATSICWGFFQQECENEVAVKLELALASQREKIQEECSKELKQRQSTFLATAHQEWSKAQKVVVAAEIEHLKRKWKEEQERKMKVLGICNSLIHQDF